MSVKIRCRLFVDSPLNTAGSLTLSRDQAHYLRAVLRLAEGDHLLLFNGSDGEWRARLTVVSKTAVTVDLEARTQSYTRRPPVILFFAPLKKAPTDYLIQKTVELGVTVLQPVITHRTNSERVRVDRLLATATEAAEQSGRLDRPLLRDPVRLQDALDSWDTKLPLLACAEAGEAQPIASTIQSLGGHQAQAVGFLIGPEGGFSEEERRFITTYPFIRSVGLGPRLLRAETAAVTTLSIWQALAGDGSERPFFHL